MSNFTEYFKEKNLNTGVSISVLITFVAYISTIFYYQGYFMYADLQFLGGCIFGCVFTLKYRKPEQSFLKYGLITGGMGGFLSSVFISFYEALFFSVVAGTNISVFFYFLGFVSISGAAIGLIIGAFLGAYFMYKDQKGEYEKEEEDIDDDFYRELAEK